MGIYDRDYLRDEDEQPRFGFNMTGPRSMTVTLIIVNVAFYLANFLFFPPNPKIPGDLGWLSGVLAASNLTLMRPWLWWQFLTCGFVHASPGHIIFNMLGLYMLGRAVEQELGQKEYLRFYLVTLVVCSLIWAVCLIVFNYNAVIGKDRIVNELVGASGAVSAVCMLFVLRNPHETLIMFPIPIPIKAWAMGVLMILSNIMISLNLTDDTQNIAWGVHLTGIAFAYLYFRYQWHLGNLFGRGFRVPQFLSRPRLRVHRPADDDLEPLDMSEEVDRILDKIHQQGEGSLTAKERRMLEIASKEYQKRKK